MPTFILPDYNAVGEVGLDRVPGAALALGLIGPGTSGGFFPSNQGAGWTVGASDMTDQIHLMSAAASSGLFSPIVDGGVYALWGPWSTKSHGWFMGWSFGFGSGIDCGHAEMFGSCYDAFALNETGIPFSALLLGNQCQAKVGHLDLNATTGHQSATGVGFEPDLVVFLGPTAYPAAEDDDCISGYGTSYGLGVMDADGNQWAAAASSDFFSGDRFAGGYTDFIGRYRRFRTDSCLSHIGTTSYISGWQTSDQAAEFVSMDSDGFTINVTAAGHAANGNVMRVAYIALKISPGQGSVKVGHGVQGDTSLSCGFAPEALLLASGGLADEATHNDNTFTSVGLTGVKLDATPIQRSVWEFANSTPSGAPPPTFAATDLAAALHTTAGIYASVVPGPAGAALTWTGDDSVARKFGWVAIQVADGLPFRPDVTTGAGLGICHAAGLNGTVTPNAAPGHTMAAYFQWGATTGYGHQTAPHTVGGDTPIALSDTITGLNPGDVIHFRLITEDVDVYGNPCFTLGDDETFTVQPCETGLHLQVEPATLTLRNSVHS